MPELDMPGADPVQLPPVWKRPIPLIIASAAAIAFAMYIFDRTQPRYLIEASALTGDLATGVSGTFQVKPAPRNGLLAQLGIPSDRVAGACIVFHPKDLGYTKMAAIDSCSLNSHCYTDELPANNPSGSAYCHQNRCWAKPAGWNAKLCNKGEVRDVGKPYAVPGTPPAPPALPVRAGSNARLVACLNKKGAVVDQTGCATVDGPDRLQVFGPEFTVN